MTTQNKPARRSALETPFSRDHERSMEARLEKGRMPKALPELLRWYSEAWDCEVPTKLHNIEVWYGQSTDNGRPVPQELTGGSKLGTHAWSGNFRAYLEDEDNKVDQDGYYRRPTHAALARLGHRKPMMARNLFALAQSGYDWRGVATRGHWDLEMYEVYITEALRKLWVEYAEQKVRLE